MQKKPTTHLERAVRASVDRNPSTLPTHEQNSTNNSLRDVILGGQDGLVNMLGIALGVVAGGGSNHVLLVTGIAASIHGAKSAFRGRLRAVRQGDAGTEPDG